MRIIQVDVLFAANALLDWLLLHWTAEVGRRRLPRLRGILAALLGGAYSAAALALGGAMLHSWWVQGGTGLVMVTAAFGWKRGTLRCWVIFLILSATMAGILLLLTLVRGDMISHPQRIPQSDWTTLLLAVAVCNWIAVNCLAGVTGVKSRLCRPAVLWWQGRRADCTLLLDTGNCLSDPAGRGAVAVLYYKAADSLFSDRYPLTRQDVQEPAAGFLRLSRDYGAGRLQLLPYRTTGIASGLLLALRIDRLEWDGKSQKNMLVAFSPYPMSDGSYDGVIGL